MSATAVVTLHGFAHGGEAVGRMEDGRVVFVAHTIPGETVRIRLVDERKRWCRAELVEVLDASPQRVIPPCPYFGPGRCGGCRLQHISGSQQHRLLRQVVVDQLERLGRLPDPPVDEVVGAGDYGYRTRARFAVSGGNLGFRRHASHDVLPIDRCLLLDEPTQRLRDSAGDAWEGADEVEVRTGVEGECVVAIARNTPRVQPEDGHVTEQVAGFAFRVSPLSFFQSNRAGAEHLLRLVREAVAVQAGETALDLYAGVGLFARGLAHDGAAVTAVEGHGAAAQDARHNLAGLAKVVQAPVERAVSQVRASGAGFDVVVLDPPRSGASKAVIDGVGAIAGRAIVIVACDPAALGRDAGRLAERGWNLHRAVPVDQFAQTGHVEVVATFRR